MNTKKKKNSAGNENKSHDVAGIVCIIISSFFLICLITPLLSDIGVFVKNLTMGLFGYTSYPMILCTLLIGILLLMNKKAAITGKQATFILLMAVFAILILHTAIDMNSMRSPFGEYLSSLISFNKNNTTAGKSVGGVFFGIFAYGFKTVLTFVGAFILYSLLFVLFGGLLIFDLRVGLGAAKKQKPRELPFEKGKSSPQPVREINDNTLFVYKIEPADRTSSQSGDFSSMTEPYSDTVRRYDSARETQSDYDERYDDRRREPERDGGDLEARERARKILYGQADEMFKTYDERIRDSMNIHDGGGRSNRLIDDAPIRTHTSPPDISGFSSGSKGGYGAIDAGVSKTEPKQAFPDVPIPPEKDISGDIVEGPILNGEALSRNIQDSIRLRRQMGESTVADRDRQPAIPPIITGNPMFEPEVKSAEPPVSEDLPPIISGNPTRKVEPEPEVKPAEPPVSEDLPPIISGNPIRKVEPKPEVKSAEPPVSEDLPPIISGNPPRKVEPEPEIKPAEPPVSEDLPPIISGNPPRRVEPEPEVKPAEPPVIEDLPPIISGNPPRRVEPEPEVKPAEPPVIEDLPPIISGDSASAEDDFDETEELGEVEEQAPIVDEQIAEDEEEIFDERPIEDEENVRERAEDVSASSDESQVGGEDAGKSYYEKTVLEEPDATDILKELEIDDYIINGSDDVSEEKLPEEEHTTEAKIPDSLKLIDEVVDMSETHEEIDDDNTGYYVSEGFSRNVDELSLKLSDKTSGIKNDGKDNNQIHMDDYTVDTPPAKPKKKKHTRYTPPPVDLLINSSTTLDDDGEDYEANSKNLEEILHNLKVDAKVIGVTHGPAVTRYELEMSLGQTVKKIIGLADDITYALAAPRTVRIEAPIKGKRAVGVEVPNKSIATVSLREIIDSKEFNEAKSCLTLALGKDITGNIITCNLEKMPHLLIAGTTGSGKSACLNSIIISLLYKASPDDVRIILIDPKQVEFVLYRDMPHLLIKNIINDTTQAINAFQWAREEMDRRYNLFAKYGARNLGDFNDSPAVKTGVESKIPRIVIIVDELAELMISKNSKELEQDIKSLAQKARAAGMHLVLATQRPSVDVLTGTIKANLPSRIAFAVKSIIDSRTILDQLGAEALLGRGDMLYAPLGEDDPKRVQGAFVSTEEAENIVNFVRDNNEIDYDESVESVIMKKPEEEAPASSDEEKSADSIDPLMKEVLRKVIESRQASASQIQRRFSVGYNRAARIIDQMEENGYIGPLDGSKPREVYITREKFREIYGEDA